MIPATATDAVGRAALNAAQRFRLPFGRQAWRGAAGGWQGTGLGSSIDFQDHRAYLPGDDPRYIHWSAYARTGQLTMKLYRAEVSPVVDVVVDASASMRFTAEKAATTDALLRFCVASADRAGSPARVHAARGRDVRVLPGESVRNGRWRERLDGSAVVSASVSAGASATMPAAGPAPNAAAAPGPLPWRAGALKILISDLLFPGDPAGLLAPLSANGGLAILFVPGLASEAEMAVHGNIELVDCESGARRRQRIDAALADRYQAAYQRHFALWREACARRGVLFARIPCELELGAALAGEARANGAVEAQR